MTLVKTILNTDNPAVGSDALVWNNADKANFTLVSVSPVGPTREAIYQKVDDDDEHPMTVRLGVYPNAKLNGDVGQTNISLKVQTFVEYLNTDVDQLAYYPMSVTIATTGPGNGVADTADYLLLLQNAFSWMLPLVDGTFGSTVVDQLRFGVVSSAAVVDDPTA